MSDTSKVSDTGNEGHKEALPRKRGWGLDKVTNLAVQSIHLARHDLVGLLDIRVVEEVLLELLRLGRHLQIRVSNCEQRDDVEGG